MYTSNAAQREPLRGIEILVVEDDPGSGEILGVMLACYGALITVAWTVDEAVEAIRGARPQVIVTDLTHPGDDGGALLCQLRQIPEFRDTPAIALIAQPPLGPTGHLPAFESYLEKPVSIRTLCGLIRQLADESRR